MRKGLLLLLAPLLLAIGFVTAGAEIHNGLTIQQIQASSGLGGSIAPPDTVTAVIGIITEFDEFPTGFGFYIQDGTGTNSGIDVFTGGANYVASLGLQVGDRVSVTGRLEEFRPFTAASCYAQAFSNGLTEITSLSGAFPPTGAQGVQVTVLSSGNPLPAFHNGTVAQLKENCTNATAELYEGVLVNVPGPMRVVRTTCSSGCTGGLGGFRSALLVNNTACPPSTPAGSVCDSMFIDLSTLSFNAVDPGTVGQLVDFVRGVYGSDLRGYRIQVRDGNDYGIQAAPTLLRAYAIGANKYRLIFDRDAQILTGSPETTFDLASFGNVDAVTQVDGTTIDLDVSSVGLSPGDNEAVTVTNIASASNASLVATSGQDESFRYGIVSPAQIQTADPDSLALACHDVTQYLRNQLNTTFRGVCTAKFDNLYYIQGSTGPRDAVAVFAPPSELTVGNQYVLVASLTQERFDETQMSQIIYLADEGPTTIPATLTIPIATMTSVAPCGPIAAESSVGQQVEGALYGEDYECMLVKAAQAKVVTETGQAPAGGFFDIAGPYFAYTDTINVDDDGSQTYEPIQGNLLDVTGILHFSFGEFRLQPRDDNDIVLVASGVTGGTTRGIALALANNPSRSPRVEFSLGRDANVDLSVFDVSGRKVQTIVRGAYTAGAHTEAWNGLDARGKAAEAGVYFYRLTVDGETYEVRGVKLN
jgi:hypothetical protein